MNKPLEAWMYRDPADVAERIELQANAAEARRREIVERETVKQAERQRIRALVFRKAGAG
jgi:hypothetical protein